MAGFAQGCGSLCFDDDFLAIFIVNLEDRHGLVRIWLSELKPQPLELLGIYAVSPNVLKQKTQEKFEVFLEDVHIVHELLLEIEIFVVPSNRG